jgi:hypothetical protein
MSPNNLSSFENEDARLQDEDEVNNLFRNRGSLRIRTSYKLKTMLKQRDVLRKS